MFIFLKTFISTSDYMERNINAIRREYNFSGLSRKQADKNPFRQFEQWLNEAVASDEKDPTAMTLVTVGRDGFPSSRIVLLKFFDEEGFVFFTNYQSGKGKEISYRSAAGLHFYWPSLERQVRITGTASKTDRELSKKYFYSRPPESRISAWASEQSREIPSREYLEKQMEHYRKKFSGGPVPLPDHWGGYRIVPHRMEFWQGRENRLHDRLVYDKSGHKWKRTRLAP